jgi:hypothetical protein
MKTSQSELEIVTRKGKPVSVIIPIKAYEELLEHVEGADDVAWLKRARRKPLHYRPLEDYLVVRSDHVSSPTCTRRGEGGGIPSSGAGGKDSPQAGPKGENPGKCSNQFAAAGGEIYQKACACSMSRAEGSEARRPAEWPSSEIYVKAGI